LSIADVEVVSTGAVAGVIADAGKGAAVAEALVRRHAHAECWPQQEPPERRHYGTPRRVPAIVCQADAGWITTRRPPPGSARPPPTPVTGAHGFDAASPEMRAVFVADGPSFAGGVTLAPFDNVDVYPLLMRLLGVPAEPNDKTPRTFEPVLKLGL